MPDVSEIVQELERYGVPNARANLLAAQLIVIGAEAAVYRPETADKVAELAVARRKLRPSGAQYVQYADREYISRMLFK